MDARSRAPVVGAARRLGHDRLAGALPARGSRARTRRARDRGPGLRVADRRRRRGEGRRDQRGRGVARPRYAVHGAHPGHRDQDAALDRRAAGASRHHRSRDHRPARRPIAHAGDRPRPRPHDLHLRRLVRVGDAARPAARRQRVHLDAAPDRRRAADRLAQQRARGQPADQRRQRDRGPARSELGALRPHRDRRVGQPAHRGSDHRPPARPRPDRWRLRHAQGPRARRRSAAGLGRLLRLGLGRGERRLVRGRRTT